MTKTTAFQVELATRDKILEMLREEQRVRYSPDVQEAYTQQYYKRQSGNHTDLINIEREIQKFILRKFGYTNDETSLSNYWKIPSKYWNDEEVKNSIFYMKLNIMQIPKNVLEDEMINVPLIHHDTEQIVSLRSLQTAKPLVLLAGSIT